MVQNKSGIEVAFNLQKSLPIYQDPGSFFGRECMSKNQFEEEGLIKPPYGANDQPHPTFLLGSSLNSPNNGSLQQLQVC